MRIGVRRHIKQTLEVEGCQALELMLTLCWHDGRFQVTEFVIVQEILFATGEDHISCLEHSNRDG